MGVRKGDLYSYGKQYRYVESVDGDFAYVRYLSEQRFPVKTFIRFIEEEYTWLINVDDRGDADLISLAQTIMRLCSK